MREMGRLTSAVNWWEESQMRVLVLGSVVVQFILLYFSHLRRRAIPGWIRFLTWLAYLGGDAIAIYALATLFNRHKEDQCSDRSSSSRLEVVWAPILLFHLGGNDGITAYNIEDNELWTRHLLTAVSQVTVAIYVFCKSWPGGDKRLLQAAIVLFVPGVLKCFAKPWDLKRASIRSLVSSLSAKKTTKQNEDMKRRTKVPVREQKGGADEQRQSRQRKRDVLHGEMDITLEQYVEIASAFGQKYERDARVYTGAESDDLDKILPGEASKLLFVDLPSPYTLRLRIFRWYWMLSENRLANVHGLVRHVLARAFIFLYTKVKKPDLHGLSLFWKVFDLILYSRLYLPWAAIGLFHHSHREAYSGIDVKITYALFCCAAVLEMYSFHVFLENDDEDDQWPETVAQYNLIGYFARNKNHSIKMWIADKSGCKDFLDQHWCMRSCFTSGTIIMELILGYLKAGWKEKICDPVSYRRFNDNRGQWALEGYEDELGWSIKGPFDKSVLLWHIATDFCFFLSPFSEHTRVCNFGKVPSTWLSLYESLGWGVPTKTRRSEDCRWERLAGCKAVHCRQMSNYMVYLLFVNSEMLLPGTRRNLFTTAYYELKDILEDNKLKPTMRCCCCCCLEEKEIMETLVNTMQDNSNKEDPIIGSQEKSKKGQSINEGSQENFIEDAWELAQGLLKLNDDFGEEKMWEVIQGVWLEMLCFSASRCRGYLHAKALGSGGEFLSCVWLLLFYMGMETFTERLQRDREDLPSQEANNNAAPPAFDTHNGSDIASSPTSMIRSGAARSPSPSYLGYLHRSTSNSDGIQMANMV